MKIELSLAQLVKLSRVPEESWKSLVAFVRSGGSGDFTPDLHVLRELGLVSKKGPCAYARFPIDGALPTQLPHAAKRKKSNSEFGAFMAAWRRWYAGAQLTGRDLAALKRFVVNYSIEEFTKLLIAYDASKVTSHTLHDLWIKRNRLIKSNRKKIDPFSGELVDE